MMSSIDISSHAESEHRRVFTVKKKSTIDHVEEEMKVSGVCKVASHTLKHSSHQLDPHIFVQLVKTSQLLQDKFSADLLVRITIYCNLLSQKDNWFIRTSYITNNNAFDTDLAHDSSFVKVKICFKSFTWEWWQLGQLFMEEKDSLSDLQIPSIVISIDYIK